MFLQVEQDLNLQLGYDLSIKGGFFMRAKKIFKFATYFLFGVLTLGAFSQCRPKWNQDHSDKILSYMDRKISKLDLDESQNAKYQSIRARIQADLKLGHQERLKGIGKIKSEFQKENPDVKTLSLQIKEDLSKKDNFMFKAPEYFAEIYAILNLEQKKKVKEWVNDKLEDFEPVSN